MYRLISLAVSGLLFFAVSLTAHAQGTSTLALSQQVDVNGKPLAGALVYTYLVGTVAQPQNTFQDTGLTIQNPWPLTADQNGRIPMFYMANGSTHIRLTDAVGNVQYDNPNVLVIGPSGGSGGAAVDPTTLVATGDLKARYGTGPLNGYVRANGLTMGNATSGATERANADTQALFVYLYGADANLVVSGGRTGNALNDYNSSKTITLPDWRGRTIAALDDMGNSAAGRLTNTYLGTGATTLGAAGGGQSQTLITSNLPPYTPAGAINASGTVVAMATVNTITNGTQSGSGNPSYGVSGTQNISASSTFTGSAQGGASTPFSRVQPTMLATIYLKL
jgi:hypothetical protein